MEQRELGFDEELDRKERVLREYDVNRYLRDKRIIEKVQRNGLNLEYIIGQVNEKRRVLEEIDIPVLRCKDGKSKSVYECKPGMVGNALKSEYNRAIKRWYAHREAREYWQKTEKKGLSFTRIGCRCMGGDD